jgi:hypothetical protein
MASLAMALTASLVFHLPAQGAEALPFKGHAEETVISARPIGDDIVVTASGTGQATHLGRFVRVASVVIHADGSAEGTAVFIAANGDQLFAAVTGIPVSATNLAGTYVFIGGTGRFREASGVADFEGFTADGVHIAVDFKGTIQYQGRRNTSSDR